MGACGLGVVVLHGVLKRESCKRVLHGSLFGGSFRGSCSDSVILLEWSFIGGLWSFPFGGSSWWLTIGTELLEKGTWCTPFKVAR